MTGKEKTIQIQAVLYGNHPDELGRPFHAASRAAEIAREQGWQVSLRWGDAGEKPCLSPEEWEALRDAGEGFEKAELIHFGENTGYGRGNNRLTQDAQAAYLLIMNPEILLPPEGILDLAAAFEDPEVGLSEARQIPVEHPKEYDRETNRTEWASGACFMIPAALFRELGGFDTETFFMYCEDVDLSWRIREKGLALYYQTRCGAFHARRLGTDGRNRASGTEMQYTVLSEALLAYKWSWPEYARERIRLAVLRGDPGAGEAEKTFRRLEKEGKLPDMHDPEHRIAHIIQYPESGGMLFARHQFVL